eukprot:116400_1
MSSQNVINSVNKQQNELVVHGYIRQKLSLMGQIIPLIVHAIIVAYFHVYYDTWNKDFDPDDMYSVYSITNPNDAVSFHNDWNQNCTGSVIAAGNGVFLWAFQFIYAPSSPSLFIGVHSTDGPSISDAKMLCFVQLIDSDYNDPADKYQMVQDGDVVTMILNFKNGTLTFKKAGCRLWMYKVLQKIFHIEPL